MTGQSHTDSIRKGQFNSPLLMAVDQTGKAFGEPQAVMERSGFNGTTMQDLLMIKALGL